MALKERLIQDVTKGSKVTLFVMNREFTGTVLSIDEDVVELQKEDGKRAIIDTATISYYEVMDAEETVSEEVEEEVSIDNEQQNPDQPDILIQAVIDNNRSILDHILQSDDLKESLGYDPRVYERIALKLKNSDYPVGNDDYSKGTRIYQMTGEMNSYFAEYLMRSLNDTDKPSRIPKSVSMLQYYYYNIKDCASYLHLYHEYRNNFSLSRFYYYEFLRQSLKEVEQAEDAELNQIEFRFNSDDSFISFFEWLKQEPDAALAKRGLHQLYENMPLENAPLKAYEYLSEYDAESVEEFRQNIFMLYLNAQQEEQAYSFLDKISNEESSVDSLLADDSLGYLRALHYLKENGEEDERVRSHFEAYRSTDLEELSGQISALDETKRNICLIEMKEAGLAQNDINKLQQKYVRWEDTELYQILLKYDEAALSALLKDRAKMIREGYTEEEIDRFEKLLSNHSFATGSSDYDTAGRLQTFGFTKDSVRYYRKIANQPENERRNSAINLLVESGFQNRDYELIIKYYPLMDPKRQEHKNYRRGYQQALYHFGYYEQLHDLYLSEPDSTVNELLYGALLFEMENEELFEKVLATEPFNYDFWQKYLNELSETSFELYRSRFAHLLKEKEMRILSDPEAFQQLLNLNREVLKDPEISVLPLLRFSLEPNQETLSPLEEAIQKAIDDLEFAKASRLASYVRYLMPEEEGIASLQHIAENGMDVYNMLPQGNDAYSRGKRILLLGDDSSKAIECFKDGIENSNDDSEITLCASELMDLLLSQTQYAEALKWARVLLKNRACMKTNAILYSIKEACNAADKEDARALCEELCHEIDEHFKEENFDQAIRKLQLLQSVNPEHEYVKRYNGLLEYLKGQSELVTEGVIGHAVLEKYVKNDTESYRRILLDGFRDAETDNSTKKDIVTLLINELKDESGQQEILDEILSAGIAYNEQQLDQIYQSLSENSSLDHLIHSFTHYANQLSGESRRMVLTKLESLYRKLLLEEKEFDQAEALESMRENLKLSSSAESRLIYLCLLLKQNKTEETLEAYALMQSALKEKAANDALYTYCTKQLSSKAVSKLPALFRELVKENTLLRMSEHMDEMKDFILFSSQEEKIHSALLTTKGYNAQLKDPVFIHTLIKTLYLQHFNYKFWYLYFLVNKESTDYALLYRINAYLSNVNNGESAAISRKQRAYYLHQDPDVNAKYAIYDFYDVLYGMYLSQSYQKNPSILNRLNKLSKDRGLFRYCGEYRSKAARDYIHLLHLLDDRDDYIYIKCAMFIATNNNEIEYFYDLFREDLLHREPVLAIKMCIEMILGKKMNEELYQRIITDLKNTSSEHQRILNVLAVKQPNAIMLCRLLKDYPDVPKEGFLKKTLESSELSIREQIAVLEQLDACYEEADSVRHLLHAHYQIYASTDNFDRIYQLALQLANKENREEELFGYCRQMALIAIYTQRSQLLSDIRNLYEKQSLEQENREALESYIQAAEELQNAESTAMLRETMCSLITNRFNFRISLNNLEFIQNAPGIKELMAYSRNSFLKSILNKLMNYKGGVEEEKATAYIPAAAECLRTLYSLEAEELLQQYYDQRVDLLRKSYYYIPLNDVLFSMSTLLMPIEQLELIFDFNDFLYSVTEMENMLRKLSRKLPGYREFILAADRHYHSRETKRLLLQYLFEEESYDELKETYLSEPLYQNDAHCLSYYRGVKILMNDADVEEVFENVSEEELIDLILLLMKYDPASCEKVIRLLPEKTGMIRLIQEILTEPKEEQLDTIQKLYPQNDALLRLFAMQNDDPLLSEKFTERFGEGYEENDFIVVKLRSNAIITQQSAAQSHLVREAKNDETMEEIPVLTEAYAQYGLAYEDEKKAVSDLLKTEKAYDALGTDLTDNLVYRKELMSRMAYLAEMTKQSAKRNDYAMQYMLILYHSLYATDREKAKSILFDSFRLMNINRSHKTLEIMRKGASHLLQQYRSVEEVSIDAERLEEMLNRILSQNMVSDYSYFYRKMIGFVRSIRDIEQVKEASKRMQMYDELLKTLQNYLLHSQDKRQINQTYNNFNKLIRNEIRSLQKGAILQITVESSQTSSFGSIFCIMDNSGYREAKDITIRAVFDESIRCKDAEKQIPLLYGRDSRAFSFNIRCKEEGVHQYRLEVSYTVGEETITESRNEEIRIVKETTYEHIGNLYSVAPVTSNDEFYGREKEKEEIFTFLNDTKYNTSLVMHGLKRVGKTSMLRYIERYMRNSQNYIPVYKSAQGIGESNAIGQMFVYSVMEELANNGITDARLNSFRDTDYDKYPEKLYDFFAYLQKSDLMHGKRILFMADEIEEIFDMVNDNIISNRIYKVLRVIVQELTSIRFIFCGADYLTDILYNHSLADIFEVTKRITISRLDEESMRHMILDPAKGKMSYSERAIERIWYYTSGHTFYSKHICSKAIDILNAEGRKTVYAYDIDTAVTEILRVTEYFVYLSRFFSANEKEVIAVLCQNIPYANAEISYGTLEKMYPNNSLKDTLNGLEFKDIIIRKERFEDDYYRFSLELFRLWYSKAQYMES